MFWGQKSEFFNLKFVIGSTYPFIILIPNDIFSNTRICFENSKNFEKMSQFGLRQITKLCTHLKNNKCVIDLTITLEVIG